MGTSGNARVSADRGAELHTKKTSGKTATAIKAANHIAKRVDALTGARSQSMHPIASATATPQIELCINTVSA
jgi:hypothetical protein